MNIHEGARRMRLAGRWILLVSVGAIVLLLGRAVVLTYYHLGGFGLSPGVLGLVALAFPGAALWLAGWILEGFGKDIH